MTDSARVLIVDDEVPFASSLRSELQARGGMEVRVVNEARRAIHETESFKPHVVLMDHRFPEGDIGVSELLPQLRGFMRPPEVIILTGQRGKSFDLVHEARDNACFAFQDKVDIYQDDWIFKVVEAAYRRCRMKWEA